MTSSNGIIFRVTGPLCGEFTGPGEFPAQRPVTRGFDVFFDLRLNKRLNKQPWGWWFETPSWSLWRQCNVCKMQWCGHPVLFQRCVTENGCNYWHRNGNVDIMMTSSNGILFCVTGTLCGEFTGHRWIPLKKASDGELRCFLWSACINGWENNREAGDSRRHRTHYDVIVTILRELLPLAAPKVVILTT